MKKVLQKIEPEDIDAALAILKKAKQKEAYQRALANKLKVENQLIFRLKI